MRGADAGKWEMICALPAFWTGLLYDEENLNILWNETHKWNYSDIMDLYKNVSKEGLKSKFQGESIYNYCQYLLKLSSKGLERRAFLNKKNRDEQIHLETLKKIVSSQKSPADILLEETNNGNKILALFDKPYY